MQVLSTAGSMPGSSPLKEKITLACDWAQQWYRTLPRFEERVNLGSVVGCRHPALVSEHDCVVHFARFLNDAGVDWEDMNHQVSVSRWLFDNPHPAAAAFVDGRKRWTVDLAILDREVFRTARLPARTRGFEFDAFLEFKYLKNFFTLEGAVKFGAPSCGVRDVAKDVDKIGRYIEEGVCRSGYVIVFEECDWGFPDDYAIRMQTTSGCKVRFVRSYAPPCPSCNATSALPIVWGMPGRELEAQRERGELVLGGCLVEGDGLDPEWQCQECRHCWRD